MKIKSNVKTDGKSLNHNEVLSVRSTVKARGGTWNHNEVLGVRSTKTKAKPARRPQTQTTAREKDGGEGLPSNHNEAMRFRR